MEIHELNFDKLPPNLFSGQNVIYGAGYNGKKLLAKLRAYKVPVTAFFDDDPTRKGGGYEGLKIYDDGAFQALNREATNILISSMYTEKMAQKAFDLGFRNLYSCLDFILQGDENFLHFDKYSGDENYLKSLKLLMTKFNDAESLKYLEVIFKSVAQGKASPEISQICTKEPQYFLKSLRPLLRGINFLDAGAYTGDTLREIAALEIQPASVYCFEADKNNFQKLKSGKYNSGAIKIVQFENFALWNKKTFVSMTAENYNARINAESAGTVETVTIDDYFKKISLGFVKMDIEGSERYALEGGLNVLKRDRPILAISIYHSLADVVDIPNMLMQNLTAYRWFIRKHSSSYSEAVLYGLPAEKEE